MRAAVGRKGRTVVDESWGVSAPPGLGVRRNDGPADRAAERARAREIRARERADAMALRLAARAAGRDTDLAAREEERIARREQERLAATGDPHAAAAARRRSSGRKDVVREHRDTRAYATVVDEDRIRALAGRGASITGLAAAFGIGEDEVRRVLSAGE